MEERFCVLTVNDGLEKSFTILFREKMLNNPMERIIQGLLTILNQIKFHHWSTDSFAKHKALGEAYDSLNDLIDEFVEVMIGKYGKNLSTIDLTIYSEGDIQTSDALEEIINFLTITLTDGLSSEKDSDLLNLKDEMLAVINRTKYLLTLS